jgi:hypothetical protein
MDQTGTGSSTQFNSASSWYGTARDARPSPGCAITDELEPWPQQKLSALWGNVRKACGCIGGRKKFLVNYGGRH